MESHGQGRSRCVALLGAVAVFLAVACGGDSPADEDPGPGAFEVTTLVSGLDQPTNFAFAPDGRIFFIEKRGVVRVFKDGALVPEPLIDLESQVNSQEQRGMLGLAVDPDFETNGYLYLFYTYEHDPSDPEGPKTSRLSRVTVSGDVALPETEEVVLGTVAGREGQPSCGDFAPGADCLPADGDIHIGGSLQFAPDGTLFVSIGDSAHTDDLRIRAQMLDSLAGKLLRINPDGSAPPDNPYFTGDAASNRSKVWAYGLREPFRFALQPGTGLPFVGDVGSLFSEEISIARAGANLGWPCFEGPEPPFGIGDHEICHELRDAPAAVSPPLYAYKTKPAAAVVGGDFAQAYPEPFAGAFFFADFARSTISYLTVDEDGELIDVEELPVAGDGPVALRTGPDGDIYVLSFHTGELRHLEWVTEP